MLVSGRVISPQCFFSFRRRDSDYRFQGLSLYKELIYTAFTRARDRWYLHPEDMSLEQWVGRNQRQLNNQSDVEVPTLSNRWAQPPEWLSGFPKRAAMPWWLLQNASIPTPYLLCKLCPLDVYHVVCCRQKRWLSMEWTYTS